MSIPPSDARPRIASGLMGATQEVRMKVIAAGLAALFVAVSPLAHAQTSTAGVAGRLRPSRHERLDGCADRHPQGHAAAHARPGKILAAARAREPPTGQPPTTAPRRPPA